MSKERAFFFAKRVFILFAILLLVTFILFLINMQTNLFTPYLEQASVYLNQANIFLDQSLMTGISIGMIILAVSVLFLPLILRGIKKQQYMVAVRRGVLSTIIFFVSQLLYTWSLDFGKSYLLLSIIIVLIVTFIIIEILSRFKSAEEEASFRTDLFASMSAGLVSSIVLTLIQIMIK